MLSKLIFLILFLSACTTFQSDDQSTDSVPAWLDSLKRDLETPGGSQSISVYRFDYRNLVVYYIPPRCCDRPGLLYDSDGRFLCYPDGGFSGGGNAICEDFFITRKHGKLISL